MRHLLFKPLRNPLTTIAAPLLLSSALFASAHAAPNNAAAKTITPFVATYTLNFDGKNGTATRTLSTKGNQYHYRVTATAAKIASGTQSASGIQQDGKIHPQAASTAYKIAGIGRTHTVAFGNPIKSNYKGKTVHLSAAKPAFDELSLELQIRSDLLNNQFLGSYLLVKKNEIEPIRFKKSGVQKITVPAGTYDTVLIERVCDNKGRATQFWLAPSLDYLPIKVVQRDDSKTIAMQLQKVQ